MQIGPGATDHERTQHFKPPMHAEAAQTDSLAPYAIRGTARRQGKD